MQSADIQTNNVLSLNKFSITGLRSIKGSLEIILQSTFVDQVRLINKNRLPVVLQEPLIARTLTK